MSDLERAELRRKLCNANRPSPKLRALAEAKIAAMRQTKKEV